MPYGTVVADVIQNTTGYSLGAGNASIMKNRLINGGMQINQRAYNATPTGNDYTLDRWLANVTTASKYSVSQSTLAPAGFINSALITSTSAYTPVAGDYETFQQRIEANNMSDCGWGTADAKTFTLSFWVRSSLTGTFGGSLYFPASTARTYPFSYTINVANTWEQKTITIVGDTTTNTAPTGTSLYVIVQWSLGVGSTFTTATPSWQNGNFASPTGCVNLIATSGATLYLTGVQLEVGSSATGFEYRQYQQELALCQRYYYQLSSSMWRTIIADTSTTAFLTLDFPIQQRTAPTGIQTTGSFVNRIPSTATQNSATLSFGGASISNSYITVTSTGMTIGQALLLQGSGATTIGFTGAEL